MSDMGEMVEDVAFDPALAAAVLEIEEHVAEEGWDASSRLFALVDTRQLVEREPQLAAAMGLDDASAEGSFTPVEQDIDASRPLEQVLESVMWPADVVGCAAAVERLVLPPGVDVPEDATEARAYAAEHPDRQEVRIVAGATRAGATYCALRLRAHDDPESVVGGPELVPGLLELLKTTMFEEGAP